MRVIIIALLLTVGTLSAFAQDLGARPMGMGGAFVSLADDANAVFVSPAGVGLITKESAVASTRVLAGTNYSLVAGIEPTGLGNFGVGYIESASGSQESEQTLYLTLSRNLNQAMVIPEDLGELSLGINLKVINRKSAASSYDGSVGLIFKPVNFLALGVAAGKREVKSGVSGNLFNNKIIWTVEGNKIGCEWSPVDLLAFRVGTNSSGVGIKINGLAVDYSYSSLDHASFWSVGTIR